MPTATYEVAYRVGSVWTALAAAVVLDVNGGGESGQRDNGAAFGDTTSTRCTIQIRRAAAPTLAARMSFRVTLLIDAASAVAFMGVLASWSGGLDILTLECVGFIEDLPARTRGLYSQLLYRRAPATKTTASSIENPATGGYAAGLINWVLWQAGGRPFEQAGSYPTADFYYSCDQAIRAPDWTWVAGENGWEECLRLARAVGGQLYQGLDGVIRYRQPLTMVGTAVKHYTAADYQTIDEQVDSGQLAASFTCSFTPRFVRETQRIIEDTTYRVVGAGETITVDLEPQWPIYSVVLDGGTLKAENIIATFFDGRLASYHATTGFTTTTTVYGQRITITITNNTSLAMQVSKIQIDGRPLIAGETGTVQTGSGNPARSLEDNVFVQNRAAALALAGMALAFYGTLRPVRRLTGLAYDPDRTVGETANLTASELGLSIAQHVILGASHTDTGLEMDVSLVDTTGLPVLADYWLVKSTSQSGTKKVAW